MESDCVVVLKKFTDYSCQNAMCLYHVSTVPNKGNSYGKVVSNKTMTLMIIVREE